MKKLNLIVIVFPILIIGCINEDFENTLSNITLSPEYSIPLGTTEYVINEFVGKESTSIPGDIGTVYYDDQPYKLDSLSWHRGDLTSFNVTSAKTIRENIVQLTYHVVVYNFLPTNIIIQCNFLDKNKLHLFPAFTDGPKIIKGAPVNSDGKVVEGYKEIIEVTFNEQQLAQFENIAFYELATEINSTVNGKPGRFYSDKNIEIIAGVRFKIKVTTGELNEKIK